MRRMLSMRDLKPQDLQVLSPADLTALAAQMLERIEQQVRELDVKQKLIERKDRDIAWRDAKLEKVNFELARLKRWKFGAKSEAMNVEQRQMFQDTLLEDEADLEAQLAALQAALPKTAAAPKAPRRRPRRQALPEHLRRVEHRHEPEDTTCQTQDCGQPMSRVGEDISERLDIVPAEFFVHRHIYGKWACRCCQRQGNRTPGAGASRPADHRRRHRRQRAGGTHADQPQRPPTCRTTGRRPSMPGPACTRRARRWRRSPVAPAQRCSRSMKRTSASC